MKDVDNKSNVIKEGILSILNHTGQSAIIVKEDVIGLDIFMECMLDHLLPDQGEQINYKRGLNSSVEV